MRCADGYVQQIALLPRCASANAGNNSILFALHTVHTVHTSLSAPTLSKPDRRNDCCASSRPFSLQLRSLLLHALFFGFKIGDQLVPVLLALPFSFPHRVAPFSRMRACVLRTEVRCGDGPRAVHEERPGARNCGARNVSCRMKISGLGGNVRSIRRA